MARRAKESKWESDLVENQRHQFYGALDGTGVQLSPEAERYMAMIFQKTVVRALYTTSLQWKDFSRMVLRCVNEIGTKLPKERSVTEEELAEVVDQVVEEAQKNFCKGPAAERVGGFCDLFKKQPGGGGPADDEASEFSQDGKAAAPATSRRPAAARKK